MSTPYFHIPLAKRLEAFRLNGKTKLGHAWHDGPDGKRWNYVPEGCRDSFHGCWGGQMFKIGAFECKWCEDLSSYFRTVKEAHHILSLRHTGWFVDIHGDETTVGLVLRLPARNGREQFMAATTDPWNKNTGIVEQCLYDDEDEAARAADQLAERYGESCREDDLKQTAELRIEDLREEIKTTREEIRALVAGLRESTLAPVVCERMRKDIRALRASEHAMRRRIEQITDEPWCLLPH